MAPIDILGVGSVAVDDLLAVAAYPSAGAKARVLRRERQRSWLPRQARGLASRPRAEVEIFLADERRRTKDQGRTMKHE